MNSAVTKALTSAHAQLVLANHILAKHQVVDGFGHISCRHPNDPSSFVLACSMAPALVQASDLMQFDLDGNTQLDDTRKPYLERFIHGQIYRARPDVMAVVHSHALSVIAMGATGTPVKPIFHMASFLGLNDNGDGAPLFDMRPLFGDTDLLVRNNEHGKALARALRDRSAVLMRGHGYTAVGDSIEQVVFRAIYTDINARVQQQALALGEPTYLSAGEAKLSSQTNDGVISRAWAVWCKEVTA
jgi:ribulose-5-phosphate 4-epimerase/fuculose-1-phosphate aldolase